MKKVFILCTVIFSVFLPVIAFAEEGANTTNQVVIPTVPVITTVTPASEPVVALNKKDRVGRLKTIGAQLINVRILRLDSLRDKIQANKNLITEQKATLVADIDGNFAKLNTLVTEIKNWAGDGDAAGLKEKVQSIYTDYRVFAVLIPKIHLQTALFLQSNHAAKLDDVFVKIQEKITAASQKGIDVTKWQAALDAAKAKKVDIVNKIPAITGLVNGLKPADYPDTSKQIITDGLKTVSEINKIFREIHTSLQFINQINAETKRAAMKSAQAAVKSANEAFVTAIKTAQDAYKTAVVEANKLTDKQARKEALKTARANMQAAKKIAQDARKAAVAELRSK